MTRGRTLSEGRASGSDEMLRVRLGARNKANPLQVCVKCNVCGKKRWVHSKMYGRTKFESNKWIFRCVPCASKESQNPPRGLDTE